MDLVAVNLTVAWKDLLAFLCPVFLLKFKLFKSSRALGLQLSQLEPKLNIIYSGFNFWKVPL